MVPDLQPECDHLRRENIELKIKLLRQSNAIRFIQQICRECPMRNIKHTEDDDVNESDNLTTSRRFRFVPTGQ